MGILISIVLLVALLASVPVSICLGVAALAGLIYLAPDIVFLSLLPQKVLAGINSYTLLAIPLFVLTGSIMAYGGMAQRIIDVALLFVGRIPGGLGLVTIFSTLFFSGVCGSASADTAAIGSATMPEMLKRKYPPAYATALLAAAGGTAVLIPPSIDLIVIGVLSGISISTLFSAGLLPGILNAVALSGIAIYYGRKYELPLVPPSSLRQKLQVICRNGLALIMPIIILGGILGGIFTPTEAAAVAVVYAFIVSFFIYKELKSEQIPEVILSACRLTGVVMLVLGMASAFSFVITFERIPHELAALIADHSKNWIVFVIFVNLLLFLAGMIMDMLPAIIILVPILIPVGIELGMNPVHLAILIEANVALSLFTPPIGSCLYVACGLSNTSIEAVTKPLLPFLLVLIMTLLLISYVPEITLLLPRMMGYSVE